MSSVLTLLKKVFLKTNPNILYSFLWKNAPTDNGFLFLFVLITYSRALKDRQSIYSSPDWYFRKFWYWTFFFLGLFDLVKKWFSSYLNFHYSFTLLSAIVPLFLLMSAITPLGVNADNFNIFSIYYFYFSFDKSMNFTVQFLTDYRESLVLSNCEKITNQSYEVDEKTDF